MAADAGRCQQNPFGLPLGPDTPGSMAGDLLPQVRVQHGEVELLLAEQGKLVAVLEFEEIRQAARAQALGAGSMQQHPVAAGEPRRVVAEHGAGQDIPSRAVGTEPSRLAIFARTLDGGRENNRARGGTGSGPWCAVAPPKRR